MASLPALFLQALNGASKASNLPSNSDENKELVDSALTDCRNVRARAADLSLFSPNEELEDISTRDLVYLLVPYVLADLEGRVRTTGLDDRMTHLAAAERHFKQFASDLEHYKVLPDAERELYSKTTSTIADAARRRETKIKQYQKEKELRSKIEVPHGLGHVISKRRRVAAATPDSSPTDFDLIASLLPSSSSSEEEDDSDTEDILRDATILLLRLTYAQARNQLDSIGQELGLLRSAPPPVPQPSPDSRDTETQSWRLDAPARNARGPALLDPSGKPLQPFTILPAGATDRARLQSQVFQAGHRLPSMTIDEYLEIEQQRGNIITGGGPQSEAQPTSSEQLAVDAEQDGTAFAELKGEEKRQKDENWARYTDVNPRGAGNTMNRG
ncbi:hypothetical protein BV25DRAFT_1881797 [Artomyces pyxidatus]|uniref:Uncharacterized protein n=1 Tax=Artomyces pyxidatus TaxID=48021 RepID=A0ACB8T8N8_9AGAM|nr:hypothetical protein BV25DRAFT_1881797 [Artomyces pyxidatus]